VKKRNRDGGQGKKNGGKARYVAEARKKGVVEYRSSNWKEGRRNRGAQIRRGSRDIKLYQIYN